MCSFYHIHCVVVAASVALILGLVHRDVARLVSLTCTLQVRRSEPPVLHPDRTGDAGPARATPKPVLRPPAEGDRFADPECVSARRLQGL